VNVQENTRERTEQTLWTGARELLVCFYSLCYVLEVENETGDPGPGGATEEAWSRRIKGGQMRGAGVFLKLALSDRQSEQRVVALKKVGRRCRRKKEERGA
jgi:hypothetical protein